MTPAVIFIIGLMVGGCLGVIAMTLVQINREEV